MLLDFLLSLYTIYVWCYVTFFLPSDLLYILVVLIVLTPYYFSIYLNFWLCWCSFQHWEFFVNVPIESFWSEYSILLEEVFIVSKHFVLHVFTVMIQFYFLKGLLFIDIVSLVVFWLLFSSTFYMGSFHSISVYKDVFSIFLKFIHLFFPNYGLDFIEILTLLGSSLVFLISNIPMK